MNKKRPMTLIMIEDDIDVREQFTKLASVRNDILFLGMTGSSEEGLRLLDEKKPDAVILDLELSMGQGSGLAFMRSIKERKHKPLIFLNTNTQAELIHHAARSLGVSMVFFKRQQGYSIEQVIDEMLLVHELNNSAQGTGYSDIPITTENNGEKPERIMDIISNELDLIGMSAKYKGRDYIAKAILLLISSDSRLSESPFYEVAGKEGVTYSSVIRAIQTAIKNTWYKSNIEDLLKHYTDRIDVRTKLPTPSEFIYFYAKKVKKLL